MHSARAARNGEQRNQNLLPQKSQEIYKAGYLNFRIQPAVLVIVLLVLLKITCMSYHLNYCMLNNLLLKT